MPVSQAENPVKAWGTFGVSGGAALGAGSVTVPANGAGMTNLTRNTAGNYTLNLSRAMLDTNFTVLVAGSPGTVASVGLKTTTTVVIKSMTMAGAFADTDFMNVVIIP